MELIVDGFFFFFFFFLLLLVQFSREAEKLANAFRNGPGKPYDTPEFVEDYAVRFKPFYERKVFEDVDAEYAKLGPECLEDLDNYDSNGQIKNPPPETATSGGKKCKFFSSIVHEPVL